MAIFQITKMSPTIKQRTRKWNVSNDVIFILLLMMCIFQFVEITNASPVDKWDENIRPKLVTNYLKKENEGK